MVIIELSYSAPMDKIDAHLETHRDFLQKQYDAGILIASGPQNPRTGGIIIAIGNKASIEAIMQTDPFYTNNLADYRFIEFDAVKYCSEIAGLIN